MSVYAIKYKVLNKETGRKVSVTRWRVQIRKGGENLSKLFDEENLARSWEDQEVKRINMGVAPNLIFDMKYQLEMPDMLTLLKDYFDQYMSKQAASSFKTNQNRCLRAIPAIPVYLKDLGPKIDNYRYKNTVVDAMLGRTYNKDYIEFGQFKIDTVDFWILIAYMDSRRKAGIKNNTILREISTISSAFEKVYKLYPEKFPNGLMNPVKMLPKGEKPKAYLRRKRVLSEDEAVQIAEWMKLKANQEPYYLFVTCLESGARKSEVLGAQWENVNLNLWSIHIPKTKNGRPRDIMIPQDDDFREWLKANRLAKGPIFKLTPWNFRQYWVDALKALGLYDDPDTRLHFHDTRRTALTNLIRQKRINSFQIDKEMGVSPQTVETTVQNMPDRLAEIFAKLRAGHALDEAEIMMLAGHGSIGMTTSTLATGINPLYINLSTIFLRHNMQSIKERRILYYLPLLRTATPIQLPDFTITPFIKNKEYGHLLPMDVLDGKGSLIEFNRFKSGDLFTQEIDKSTFIALERLKFSYFLQNPSHVMSIDGYVSSETFECFRCIEPSEDPAFEHKVHFSNGMYNFSESLKTYYSSRTSLNLRSIELRAWDFDYIDYFSNNTAEESHLSAMRLYNRCWSTYSLHNSIDKPVLARASIEVLAKLKFSKDALKKFIPEFFDTAFLKLDQLGSSDPTIRSLTEIVSPNRESLQSVVTEHIDSIKDARHSFAHEGIETGSLANIPFYLVWFPLYWMVLLQPDKMTTKDGIRLSLFFCLLKVKPEYWQHIDYQDLPTRIKRHPLDTYAHYSRILPKWSKERPEETKVVLSAIPKCFGI